GRATCGGRVPPTSESFSATTCRAWKMSVPQSNSTHTTAMPRAVAERTRRTFKAPLMALSIGNVTRDSISSGAIPRPSVRIVTVGAVKSGNTSTGISRAVQMPPASSSAEKRITIQWCSIDHCTSRFMMGSSVDVAFSRETLRGGRELDFIRPANHDAIADADAVADTDLIAIADRDVDVSPREAFAADLHEHVRPSSLVQDGGFRHGGNADSVVPVQDSGPVLPDEELAGAVVDVELDWQRTCFWIDDSGVVPVIGPQRDRIRTAGNLECDVGKPSCRRDVLG